MLSRDYFYILLGYLSGSILFARLFGWLFYHRDITAEGPDGNPGTANAFRYGGFWCGLFTLCGDLLKGYLPVRWYVNGLAAVPSAHIFALAFVMAAPVLGHILPVFYRFRGGKGIAVSFGCLLGVFPMLRPFATLACVFLFFSLVIKITPNYYRTLVTYIVAALAMIIFRCETSVTVGFFMIAGLVLTKLLKSREEKESFHMEAAWRH